MRSTPRATVVSILAGLCMLLPSLAAAATGSAVEGHAGAGMTHRMMYLVLQLGILLFATRLGNAAFVRLRLPGVLGELAAGMVIGPFCLGSLGFPGFPGGLFPVGADFAVSPELYGLCSIASVLLLFMVGLETDIKLFLRYSVAGTAVGVGGVIVSFLLGDLTAVWFGSAVFGRVLSPWDPASLFLGVISTATSVGITARILSEKRKLDSPEGVTILSGAVIDDVLGIILLAIVLGVVSATGPGGVSWSHIGGVAAKAVAVWLAATAVGLAMAHHIGAMLKRFRGRTSIAVMAFGLAMMLAGLFEEAGLAMIIGAYVMGLSLSRTDLAHLIRERLDPVFNFLVPVFFGVMGMLVDLRALGSGRILLFGLAYSLLAVVAKVVGSGVPALMSGFNLRGALRVGTGMVPRGEVALIVAGVGLAAGALPADVFGVAVVMTVLTTVCAPPILVLLFRDNRPGILKAATTEDEEPIRFPCGNPQQAEWLLNGLMDTLRQDGFFVHLLEHEQKTAIALRDRMSISFRRCDNDVVFLCAPQEQGVVRTAVMHVVQELNLTAEALRRPLDVRPIFRDTESGVPKTGRGLDLAPHLKPELVCLNLRGSDKESVIRELLGMITTASLIKDPDAVLAALLAREASMSTGLERGIAVPHCRTDAVTDLVCAVGLKPEGLDFGSLDGQPARTIVLTLSPAASPTPHVQFMSSMAQALTPAVCEHLLYADSPEVVIGLLTGQLRPESRLAAPPSSVARAAAAGALGGPLADTAVLTGLRRASKGDLIRALLTAMAERHGILHPEKIMEQLLRREQVMSTGLERGIAVPHCRTAGVDRVLSAIGIVPEGCDFGSMDGAPTHAIILILAPVDSPDPYVQTLASLIQALEHVGMQTILETRDAERLRGMLQTAYGKARRGGS